jgi:hypothetical protein
MKDLKSLILLAQVADSCRRGGFSRKRRQTGKRYFFGKKLRNNKDEIFNFFEYFFFDPDI